MKRLELFEFEDFKWLPNVIRSGVTNLIIVIHKATGTSKVVAQLINTVRAKSNFNQIVDMGSGSGGPMLDVIEEVNQTTSDKMNLILSDFYPNPEVVNSINQSGQANVKYHETSLNAAKIGEAPKGLKTMIASYHHMNPTVAKNILQSAQDNKQPILIYEIAKNNIPVIVWTLLLPLSLVILIVMSLVLTLFVRPFNLKQILFTYLIPVIPLVYAWDGQASIMRTYAFSDINSMIDDIKTDDYHWEVDDAKNEKGKNQGFYIMGYPK